MKTRLSHSWVLALFLLAVVATSQDSRPSTNVGERVQIPSSESHQAAPDGKRPTLVMGGGNSCATAVPIVSLPFSDTGDTTGATNKVNDVPVCANPTLVPSDPGPDLIYSFAVTTGNNLSITVSPTVPYDTSIYVLSTCGNAATCVGYSDTVPGNPPETIALSGLAPGTYYLYIDSFYSADPAGPHFNPSKAQGPYSLSVTGTLGSTTYNTVTPCRVVDTRGPTGPYGGPSLAAGADRTFVFGGQCAIPATATAVSLNVVAVLPTDGPGFLTLFPGGTARPLAATINYNLGKIRANNAIIPLGALRDITVHCGQGTGTTDMVIDVNGYFQ